MDKKTARLGKYLADIAPSGKLEEIIDSTGASTESAEPFGHDRSVLEKIAGSQSLTAEEHFHVEAVIIPDHRPVIDVDANSYGQVLHADWLHLNDADTRKRLESVPAECRTS